MPHSLRIQVLRAGSLAQIPPWSRVASQRLLLFLLLPLRRLSPENDRVYQGLQRTVASTSTSGFFTDSAMAIEPIARCAPLLALVGPHPCMSTSLVNKTNSWGSPLRILDLGIINLVPNLSPFSYSSSVASLIILAEFPPVPTILETVNVFIVNGPSSFACRTV